MDHETMVDDAGWCWFQDPRAIRHVGEHDRTYFGWISRFGDVTVGGYDHETGGFERHVIHELFEPDDHDVPTLTVRPDGRLIVFYTGHNGPAVHHRIATSAESIANFGPRQSLEPGHETNVTYPDPRWIDDELHLFLRNRGSIVNLVSHDDGETWSEERELVSTGGTGLCVYSKISREHEGEVTVGMTHAIGGWNEPHRHVTHARFDGDALRTTDGDLLGRASEDSLPVPIHETTTIYDSEEAGTDAWVWDCSIADGVPQVAYAQLVADQDHRYRYARWDGKRWQDTLVCHGGTYSFMKTVENGTTPAASHWITTLRASVTRRSGVITEAPSPATCTAVMAGTHRSSLTTPNRTFGRWFPGTVLPRCQSVGFGETTELPG